MAPAHNWQIQDGCVPNTLVGVYVTKPQWPGGKGGKGGNTVTTPKAPQRLACSRVEPTGSPRHTLLAPEQVWLGTFDYTPPCSYKSNTSQENKTLLSPTKRDTRKKEKEWREEQVIEKVAKIEMNSPKAAQEMTLLCLWELINVARNQVQEALEKCTQSLGLCVMVMFAVDLLRKEEGRKTLFLTDRSSQPWEERLFSAITAYENTAKICLQMPCISQMVILTTTACSYRPPAPPWCWQINLETSLG